MFANIDNLQKNTPNSNSNLFAGNKKICKEMMRERLQLANEMRDYIGKFYSVDYVRKNILKQKWERKI